MTRTKWDRLDAVTRQLSTMVGSCARLARDVDGDNPASDVATILLFATLAVAMRDDDALHRIARTIVVLDRERDRERAMPTTCPTAVFRLALAKRARG